MATALARLVVRLAAPLVPRGERADWRREWLAELEAVAVGRRSSPWRFAMGAPWHALALRANGWRPSAFWADARHGTRWLRRRPVFALTAVATLALGVGAVTAMFAIVYGVLLKPLPYREPTRLVQLWETNPLFNWTEAAIAPGNAISWRERNHVFEDMAWYLGTASREAGAANLTVEGDPPARVHAMLVWANFFEVLGAPPAIGRTFAPDEDEPGKPLVIVLSDAFWRARFGADPHVVGETLRMSGRTYTVIGVMPAVFHFDQTPTDFWLAITSRLADFREVRRPHSLRAIARLKPGVTPAEARRDLSAVAAALEREYPDTNHLMGVGVGPLDDWFVGPVRRPLVALFLAIALVLVIACANVANLLLVGTSERAREIAVRAAIGASHGRLVRQFLTESLLLAIGGTACGVLLAEGGLRAFVALAPAGVPRLAEISLNPTVGLFAVGLAIMTTVAVGVAPAWHGAREDVRRGLGDGVRTTTTGVQRVRRGVVTAEVALAAVLLVGAFMAVRSFRALLGVNAGFPVDGLVVAKISLPNARYGSPNQASAFFGAVSANLRAEPGVSAAGATLQLPLEGSAWTGDLYIEGRPEFHGRELRHKSITTGYLEALGVPLVAGRTIGAADRTDTPLVAVANTAFASRFFPAGGALGARVAFDDPSPRQKWTTIVGVVGDERQDSLAAPPVPEVYEAETQDEFSTMSVAVRSARPAGDVVALIRRDVRAIDPQLALSDAGPFADRLDRSVMPERAAATAIELFAVCAVLLATIGVYGVAAGVAAGRVREIGIRLAFGATGADVVGLIVRQEFVPVAVGLAIGGLLAAAAGRVVGAMFYGVTGHDALSFVAGAVTLLATGAVACLIPARRALRVDPAAALRQ
jgi:predicted permease